MATKRRCIYGMQNINPSDLMSIARVIQDKLTAPQYSAVVPTPAQVIVVIDKLKAANAECIKRNYAFIPVRNSIMNELQSMLHFQCDSINGLAMGDLSFLLGTGFDLNKEQGRRAVPEKGEIKDIKTRQQEGQIEVYFKGVKGRDYYEVRAKGGGVTRTAISTKPYVILEELPMGKRIIVTYRAINARGEGPWSNPFEHYIPHTEESLQRLLDGKK